METTLFWNQFQNSLITTSNHLFQTNLQVTTQVSSKADGIENDGDAYTITVDMNSVYTNRDDKEGLMSQFPPTNLIVDLTR